MVAANQHANQRARDGRKKEVRDEEEKMTI
jgi:hypothetical protein